MRLHCFGTTGYHPSPSRHTACYYLPDASIVLDAGTGIFRLIESLRSEPKTSLDILLSHAHLDHVVGLTFLIDAVAVTPLEHIRLHGEREKLEAVRHHLYDPLLFPVPPSFEFLPIDSNRGWREIGSTKVEWFPLDHPGGSLGYLLEFPGDVPRRLAYVTDTFSRSDHDYQSKIAGVDLLMHECYFSDDMVDLAKKTGHSYLAAVTEIIRAANAKQNLLIHINPLAEILDQPITLGAEQAGLNVSLAKDLDVIEF
ncbi:MAG TPA: ribonuclease Z [Planctomycetaceae bacterium]|nr:ribonuclease Z [Planctomycetaceae bacterium]